MKKNLILLLTLIIGASYPCLYAQHQGLNKGDSLSVEMMKIAKPESEINWINFKDSTNINPASLFTEFKAAFNLKNDDKMQIVQITKDDLGYTHHRYQQYYKNIRIDGGTYTIHTNRNGISYAANGKLFIGIDINVVPGISPKQAINEALKYVNANEYMWQSEFMEKELKEKTGKADTSYYPTPELVIREIINRTLDENVPQKQYFLAYRLDINSISPFYSQRIFIDANSGIILLSIPLQSN